MRDQAHSSVHCIAENQYKVQVKYLHLYILYKVQLVTKEVVQYYLMGQCHKIFDFSLFVNRNHLKQGIIDFLFLF